MSHIDFEEVLEPENDTNYDLLSNMPSMTDMTGMSNGPDFLDIFLVMSTIFFLRRFYLSL